MARETVTIQRYPDDSIINSTIKEYEAFGWELINNQRCQEYEGQTYGLDGSSTKHYSTFNKLTFTREKASPWYSRVVSLEEEYRSLMNTKPQEPKSYSKTFTVLFYIAAGIAIGLGALLAATFLHILGYTFIVVGAISLIYAICRTVIGKKRMNKYSAELADWKESGVRAEQLLREAERLVNGADY